MRAVEASRVCRACDTEKPLTEFHRNRAMRGGGRSYECAKCSGDRLKARGSCTERHRRWRERNPEAWRAANRRRQAARRARVRNAFVETVDAAVVLRDAEGLCGFCGDPVDPERFDVDHVVPLAEGGEHSYANSQPAHPACNRAKGRTIALHRDGRLMDDREKEEVV